MPIIKPMLAQTLEDFSDLKFPVLATPKLDGIRCLKVNGQVLSRKFKSIPNRHINALLSSLPDGLDGELMIPNAAFNSIQSAVMTVAGEPDFRYYVFDYVKNIETSYQTRMTDLICLELPDYCIKIIPSLIKNESELRQFEEQSLIEGYEGAMVRSPNSPYKNGRSTVKEGYLLKIKRFKDSEAVILDFEERMHNANEAVTNALGHTERSSHKANLIPTNTLGAFVVEDLYSKMKFKVSTGMDDVARQHAWNNQESLKGKILKYKFQEAGMKDLPRFPVFLGYRDERDMD